jgi:transmembrane sensor
MSDELIDPSLFDRYLAGECTPDEAARVRAWVAADPRRRNVDAIAFGAAAEVMEAAWGRVADRLGARNTVRVPAAAHAGLLRKRLPLVPPSSRGMRMWRVGALAGVFVAMASGAGVWGWFTRGRAPTVAHRYATGIAQVTTVRLPDGSRVTLAPRTSLLVPGDFGRDARNVSVVGEAYFEVVPAPHTPFTVDAAGARTRVLGTAFSVRRYANDTATRVAVATGRVAVVGASKARTRIRPTLVLSAGMVGIVTDSTTVVEERRDVAPYITWTNGAIDFNEAPIPQVLAELERWYGITFVLTDSTLARRHLSATLNYHERGDMLNALKQLLDVTMTFHGDTAMLWPRRSAAQPSRRHPVLDSLTTHPNNEVGR